MFIMYAPNTNLTHPCTDATAEYICNTPSGIVSGPSLCVWMVPGTVTFEDTLPRWNVNPYLRRS